MLIEISKKEVLDLVLRGEVENIYFKDETENEYLGLMDYVWNLGVRRGTSRGVSFKETTFYLEREIKEGQHEG